MILVTGWRLHPLPHPHPPGVGTSSDDLVDEGRGLGWVWPLLVTVPPMTTMMSLTLVVGVVVGVATLPGACW